MAGQTAPRERRKSDRGGRDSGKRLRPGAGDRGNGRGKETGALTGAKAGARDRGNDRGNGRRKR